MKFARLEDHRSRDDEDSAAEAWANSVSKAKRVAHFADTGVDVDDTSLVLKNVKFELPILFVVAMPRKSICNIEAAQFEFELLVSTSCLK